MSDFTTADPSPATQQGPKPALTILFDETTGGFGFKIEGAAPLVGLLGYLDVVKLLLSQQAVAAMQQQLAQQMQKEPRLFLPPNGFRPR